MAKEKNLANAENKEKVSAIQFTTDMDVPVEVREEIIKKAQALKEENKLRKIFVVIVAGEEGDSKPLYIAYMRRANLVHFSQYMNFVQKDYVQASKMLAQNIFLAGDKELIDDDELFLYGTMQQLNGIIDTRNADLVKV